LTHTLPEQTFLPLHVPHDNILPHPSSMVPQVAPSASHVFAVQPHRFALPLPPHVLGALHVPQRSVPPHPSGASPQL
jgi:hypothetical protein